MRTDVQKWHSIALQTYQALMFETLLQKHNITTDTAKEYTFEDKEGLELERPLRGFFAIKESDGQKQKYFVEETHYGELPIRVNNHEEIFFKDNSRAKSIVLRPTNITPFRIKPEQCWQSNREFIDMIAPFQHTHPDQWTLNKIIAIQSFVGKTFMGVCSHSEFGKSSIYLILDAITKKSPVFQPRSVAGTLMQITGDGIMCFDEVHDTVAEVKTIMENFSLQVAGNSPIYVNGSMAAKNTKPKYDVMQQSIVYLYNVYGNYRDPDTQFWNNIWSNKKAMESRFLTIKLEGKLLEKFDKDFDIVKTADDNKMLYIKIAKHLLYLQDLKKHNGYARRYQTHRQLRLEGRHLILFDEITWLIDQYCTTQAEYDQYVALFEKSITDYTNMLGNKISDVIVNTGTFDKYAAVEESVPISDEELILQQILSTAVPRENLLAKYPLADSLIDVMIQKGMLFESSPGMIMRLQ